MLVFNIKFPLIYLNFVLNCFSATNVNFKNFNDYKSMCFLSYFSVRHDFNVPLNWLVGIVFLYESFSACIRQNRFRNRIRSNIVHWSDNNIH